MRAQFINENIKFERGQEPKTAMGIGVDAKIMNFLEWVKNDFQLDKSHSEYSGFINLFDDGFSLEKLREGHRLFVDDYKRYLPIMKEMGLYMLEVPWDDYEETIIYDDSVLSGSQHPVLESVKFERGQNPAKAMGIGKDAVMDKKIQDLKKTYNVKFPFSENPNWQDHRANVLRMLNFSITDDQIDTFEYLLEYLKENYPDTDPSHVGEMAGFAAINGMPEFIIALFEWGLEPKHITDMEGKDNVIDMLWFLLKQRLKNES